MAAVAIAVTASLAGGGGGSATRATLPSGDPGPVVLVPGYGGNTASLDDLAAALRRAGRRAVVVPLPGDGRGDLAAQAAAVGAAVQAELLTSGAGSVDLVGYSAGGVVVRLYLQGAGGAPVRRVVAIGSPQHGTSLAGVAGALLPGACPTACQQLATGSELIRSLDRRGPVPPVPRWLSLWTTTDQTVTPPETARLAGAINVPIQSVCADERPEHSQLPRDPLVVGIVLSALDRTAPQPPGPADCGPLRAVGAGRA